MALNLYIENPIALTQDTSLYAANDLPAPAGVFDYIITVDVGADVNALFETKKYKQATNGTSLTDENNVLVYLNINRAFVDAKLTSNTTTIAKWNDVCSVRGLEASPQRFGLRLLEVMALKVFGHARARAAIENDTEFYRDDSVSTSVINQLITGMNVSVDAQKFNIFNSYVQTDRIEADANGVDNTYNDVDANYQFNFGSSNWSFNTWLSGSLLDAGTDADLTTLNNGPLVGGSLVKNGAYNIPILVLLRQTPQA